MTKANYARCLANSLVYEGGWSDHPADPGGATMRGVTQKTYDAFRRANALSRRSVAGITESELQSIYRTQYADPVRFDAMPKGIDQLLLDGSINSGPTQSVKWLQRSLVNLGYAPGKVDGRVGQNTLDAVEDCAEAGKLVELAKAMSARRLNFLQNLKTWNTFRRGWTARVNGMQALSIKMLTEAGGSVSVDVTNTGTSHDTGAKATVDDAALPKAPIGAPAVGAGAGGASAIIDELRTTLEPITGSGGFVDKLFAVVVIAGAVIAIAGMAYGAYSWYRGRKVRDALDLEVMPT